jgi:hypothetical protein
MSKTTGLYFTDLICCSNRCKASRLQFRTASRWRSPANTGAVLVVSAVCEGMGPRSAGRSGPLGLAVTGAAVPLSSPIPRISAAALS